MSSDQKNDLFGNSHFMEWMHDLEDVARIGRWEIDTETEEAKWTRGVYRIFEFEAEADHSLETHLSFYHESFREEAENSFKNLIEKGEELEYEAKIHTEKNNIKWIRVIGKQNEEPGQRIIFGTIQDITGTKEIELQKNLLINNTDEQFILVSKDLEILTFNKQFAESYKKFFNKEVKNGDSILNYALPGKRVELEETYNQVFEGQHIEKELALQAPDTECERFFLLQYKPAFNDEDQISGAFVTAREISERRKAQDQVIKNERRFRALVEQGSDGIAILDKEGNLKYITPSVERILGYNVDEIMEINIFELLHPDDITAVEAKIAESLKKPGETIQGHTGRIRHKDGNWRWLEAVVTNLVDDPVIGGIVNNFRDVTDRIEAEEKLEQAHKKLKMHLENSPLGIVEYDKDLNIIKWSQKCEEIFGWTENEILEKQFTAFDLVHQDDKEQMQQTASDLISGAKEGSISTNKNNTRDGRVIHCIWYNSIIKNDDGSVDTIMSLVQDITQSVEAETELQKSSEEKSLLLSEIHHRVKNNLAIISGLMQLQALNVNNDQLASALLSSVLRVKSIALVHEQLYSSKDFRNIRLDKNLKNLVEHISSTINPNHDVQIEYDLDAVTLTINQAVPCALFVNEAVTNVFKHAFQNSNECIMKIGCTREDENISILIEDNGKGFYLSDDKKDRDSLGLQLLEKVTEQLNGKLSFSTDNGTSVKMSFNCKEGLKGSAASGLDY